jgi:hypothetical protein
MSCCGNKRTNWREYSKQAAPAAKSLAMKNPHILFYTGETSFVIKGAVTGYTYLFAEKSEGLEVDERDVLGFLQMKKFTFES